MIPAASPSRFRWTIIAFALAGVVITALVAWQLYETSPGRWCALAANGSPEMTSGCFQVLLKLLDLKETSLMLLIGALVLTILSIVAVALGVRLSGAAPGGFSVDVGADKTTITSGEAEATVPTPPSDEKN